MIFWLLCRRSLAPVLLVFLNLQAGAFAWQAPAAKVQLYSGTVSWVADGDTIWLRTSTSSSPMKVRIQGIDAPESCQPGGSASRDALRRHILGRSVTLTVPKSRSHDDYGRTLARVQLSGEDIGAWMVSNGHAWSYAYRNNPGPYAQEQARAVAARRGLFAQRGAENPRLFRQRHGSCH
jgi:endonuclease YncB( thermonuclease family)